MKTHEELILEVCDLRERFKEAEETLRNFQNRKETVRKSEQEGISTSNSTKRKHAEKVIREDRNACRTPAENLPGMVYRVFIREDNRTEFFNNMLQTMTGYTVDELTAGRVCSIEPLILSEAREAVVTRIERAIRDHRPFEVEYPVRTKGGEPRYFFECGRPVWGEDGKPLHIDGVILDITARKVAEEAFRQSDQEKTVILNATWEAMGMVDRSLRVVWANKVCADRAGLPLDRLPGLYCYEIWAQHSEPCEGCPVLKTIETGQPEEVEISSSNGKTWLHRSYPIRDKDGIIENVVATALEITERRQIEEELRRSKEESEIRVQARTAELLNVNRDLRITAELLEKLFSNINIMIAYMDKDFNFLRVNRTWSEDDGRAPEFFVGKNLFDLFPNVDKEDFRKVMEKGEPNFGCQKLFIHPEHPERGATYWDWSLQPVKEPNRNVTGVIFSLVNVTERKRAEEALRESERRLRFLSSQLITGQEQERKRIAYELHDGLGTVLSGIKYKVEAALVQRGRNKLKAMEEQLESVIPMIQECVEEVRRIQTDLRPVILDSLGVLAAIRGDCRRFQSIYPSISTQQEVEIQEDEVPAWLKIVIYRIFQETLNNIGKYSNADLVHLSLRKREGKIELIIQDNGRGFNVDEALSRESSRRGLGLTSMRERAELSGGSFTIESIEGKGTMIRVSWPTGVRGSRLRLTY